MTREQYLLALLAEECAEVAQRATKAIRFGLEIPEGTQPGYASNKERLLEEFNDLLVIVEMLFGKEYVNESQQLAKKAKIEKYTELSKQIGKLND